MEKEKSFNERMTLKAVLENNSEFLRTVKTPEEKRRAARVLIQDILLWTTYTNYDSIGMLDSVKQYFINNAEDVRPDEFEKPRFKRRASIIRRD